MANQLTNIRTSIYFMQYGTKKHLVYNGCKSVAVSYTRRVHGIKSSLQVKEYKADSYYPEGWTSL
jgi:hypothetical protein